MHEERREIGRVLQTASTNQVTRVIHHVKLPQAVPYSRESSIKILPSRDLGSFGSCNRPSELHDKENSIGESHYTLKREIQESPGRLNKSKMSSIPPIENKTHTQATQVQPVNGQTAFLNRNNVRLSKEDFRSMVRQSGALGGKKVYFKFKVYPTRVERCQIDEKGEEVKGGIVEIVQRTDCTVQPSERLIVPKTSLPPSARLVSSRLISLPLPRESVELLRELMTRQSEDEHTNIQMQKENEETWIKHQDELLRRNQIREQERQHIIQSQLEFFRLLQQRKQSTYHIEQSAQEFYVMGQNSNNIQQQSNQQVNYQQHTNYEHDSNARAQPQNYQHQFASMAPSWQDQQQYNFNRNGQAQMYQGENQPPIRNPATFDSCVDTFYQANFPHHNLAHAMPAFQDSVMPHFQPHNLTVPKPAFQDSALPKMMWNHNNHYNQHQTNDQTVQLQQQQQWSNQQASQYYSNNGYYDYNQAHLNYYNQPQIFQEQFQVLQPVQGHAPEAQPFTETCDQTVMLPITKPGLFTSTIQISTEEGGTHLAGHAVVSKDFGDWVEQGLFKQIHGQAIRAPGYTPSREGLSLIDEVAEEQKSDLSPCRKQLDTSCKEKTAQQTLQKDDSLKSFFMQKLASADKGNGGFNSVSAYAQEQVEKETQAYNTNEQPGSDFKHDQKNLFQSISMDEEETQKLTAALTIQPRSVKDSTILSVPVFTANVHPPSRIVRGDTSQTLLAPPHMKVLGSAFLYNQSRLCYNGPQFSEYAINEAKVDEEDDLVKDKRIKEMTPHASYDFRAYKIDTDTSVSMKKNNDDSVILPGGQGIVFPSLRFSSAKVDKSIQVRASLIIDDSQALHYECPQFIYVDPTSQSSQFNAYMIQAIHVDGHKPRGTDEGTQANMICPDIATQVVQQIMQSTDFHKDVMPGQPYVVTVCEEDMNGQFMIDVQVEGNGYEGNCYEDHVYEDHAYQEEAYETEQIPPASTEREEEVILDDDFARKSPSANFEEQEHHEDDNDNSMRGFSSENKYARASINHQHMEEETEIIGGGLGLDLEMPSGPRPDEYNIYLKPHFDYAHPLESIHEQSVEESEALRTSKQYNMPGHGSPSEMYTSESFGDMSRYLNPPSKQPKTANTSQKDFLRTIKEEPGIESSQLASDKPRDRWEIEDYISLSKRKETEVAPQQKVFVAPAELYQESEYVEMVVPLTKRGKSRTNIRKDTFQEFKHREETKNELQTITLKVPEVNDKERRVSIDKVSAKTKPAGKKGAASRSPTPTRGGTKNASAKETVEIKSVSQIKRELNDSKLSYAKQGKEVKEDRSISPMTTKTQKKTSTPTRAVTAKQGSDEVKYESRKRETSPYAPEKYKQTIQTLFQDQMGPILKKSNIQDQELKVEGRANKADTSLTHSETYSITSGHIKDSRVDYRDPMGRARSFIVQNEPQGDRSVNYGSKAKQDLLELEANKSHKTTKSFLQANQQHEPLFDNSKKVKTLQSNSTKTLNKHENTKASAKVKPAIHTQSRGSQSKSSVQTFGGNENNSNVLSNLASRHGSQAQVRGRGSEGDNQLRDKILNEFITGLCATGILNEEDCANENFFIENEAIMVAFEGMVAICAEMGFLPDDYDPEDARFTRQTELLSAMWFILGGEQAEAVCIQDLSVFLLAIFGLGLNCIVEDGSEEDMFDDSEVKEIQNAFTVFYEQKQVRDADRVTAEHHSMLSHQQSQREASDVPHVQNELRVQKSSGRIHKTVIQIVEESETYYQPYQQEEVQEKDRTIEEEGSEEEDIDDKTSTIYRRNAERAEGNRSARLTAKSKNLNDASFISRNQPPKSYMSNTSTSPMLLLDVNLGGGKIERVIMHEGEDPREIADRITQDNGLDSHLRDKFLRILEEQLGSSN